MKFAGAGFFRELGDVSRMQARPRQNDDAVAGKFDEFAECRTAFGCAASSTRGEQPRSAGGDDVFEGTEKIVGVIEGAVEGDFERMGQFDELAGALDVHGMIRPQHAEDDTFHTEVASEDNVAAHGSEFRIGVNEIALARTNNWEHRNFQIFVNFAHGGNRGGDAALIELGAEFNAICASVFGS